MLPASDPGGSVGTSRLTVPSWDLGGQVTALRVPMPISLGVHASRPAAAEGFIDIPGGSRIEASLRSETSALPDSALGCFAESVVVIPSAASAAALCGSSEKLIASVN